MLLDFFKVKDVSPTKLDVVNYCIMRFALKYIEHAQELELSVFKKGKTLHDLTEHFWPRLNVKYSDAKEFGDYGYGKFYQLIRAFESSGKKVAWNYKDEMYVMAENVRKVSKSLFEILKAEGPPLVDEQTGKYLTEVRFDFRAFDRNFTGKIDEIRIRDGKLIIRDYKSGKPWMGHMKLNHDPQMTIYNVGLCSKCRKDKRFAELVGLSDDRQEFDGNPIYVSDKIQHEFFMLDAPYLSDKMAEKSLKSMAQRIMEDIGFYFIEIEEFEKILEKNLGTEIKSKIPPKIIYKTTRTNEHFFEIIKMLDGVEGIIKSGMIYAERGRKCDDCNVNLACQEKLKEIGKGFSEDKKGQLMFSYSIPYYMRPIQNEKQKIKQERLFKEPKKTFKAINQTS